MKRYLTLFAVILIAITVTSAALPPIRISVVNSVATTGQLTIELLTREGVPQGASFDMGSAFATDDGGVISVVMEQAAWLALTYNKDDLVRITYKGTVLSIERLEVVLAKQGLFGAFVDPEEIQGSATVGQYLKTTVAGGHPEWAGLSFGDFSGILPGANGGTGIDNGAFTIDIAGNITTAGALTTEGAFPLIFTTTDATNVTLPTTGTLATLADINAVTLQKAYDNGLVADPLARTISTTDGPIIISQPAPSATAINILRDGTTALTSTPVLYISDDLTGSPSADGTLVQMVGTIPTASSVLTISSVNKGDESSAVRIESSEPESYGLIVNSTAGVAANYSTILAYKSDGEGAAIIAQGTGTGSILYVDNTGAGNPSINNYALEVTSSTGIGISVNTSEPLSTAVKIVRDGTVPLSTPILYLTDDLTGSPSADGTLVQIVGVVPTASSVLTISSVNKGDESSAVRIETNEAESYGLIVNSLAGVAANYSTILAYKAASAGAAIIAQGSGTGSVVFVNDGNTSVLNPAINSYGLEVTKGATNSAALFVSNEYDYIPATPSETATALQIGNGRIVLAAAPVEVTILTDLKTLGNYSVIKFNAGSVIDNADLPAGADGQVLYIINATTGAVNICGSGLLNFKMAMLVCYDGTWYPSNL